jgi:ribonuclease HI
MSDAVLECWTDGSTIKRKGSGRGDCGVGFAVTDGSSILFCHGEFIGTQTSNYAEMYAILRCLEEITNRIEGDVQSIVVYTDNEVVAKGLAGEYDITSENLVGLVSRIEDLYGSLPAQPEYEWVPRSSDPLNEFVDLIAYTCSTGYPYDD